MIIVIGDGHDNASKKSIEEVPELAQRNADNLLQKMVEVNEAKRLVRRLPTLGMVTSWITPAKELPRVVVYK